MPLFWTQKDALQSKNLDLNINTPQNKHPRRIPVDVRDIIAEFGTVDFGTWNICEVLLSRMN